MKIVKTVLLVLVAALALGFAGIWVTVTFFGRQILASQLEQNLKVKATVTDFKVSLPLDVTITGLTLGDFAYINKVYASINPAGFLAGKILLNKVAVDDPVITIEQSSAGKLNLPVLEQKGTTPPPPILLLALSVNNGKLSYTDKKVDPKGYKIIMDKINVQVAKVALPITSLKTEVDASLAVLDPSNKDGGTIALKGWVDFGPKDMDATLTVKGLELTTFAPYAGSFLSQKKLLSAKGDITSVFTAKKDELSISNKVKLSKFVYPQEPETEAGSEGIAQFAAIQKSLDAFANAQGEVNFDFDLKTRLSKPEFTKKEIRKAVMQALGKNLLGGSTPEEVMQNLPQTIEKFKGIGKQLEGMFKKNKEEAPAEPAPQQ